ncbi:hypothetical protein [Bacillus dakarensis]|uniref:hypothetical protein n=1 Tax=Robertmurraya dakarensis TaxID=1926278 RepID=UPI00301C34A4
MLFTFRGDAHRLYLQIRERTNNKLAVQQLKNLREIEEIKNTYQNIDSSALKLIYYRMIKEKNGSGIIPIFVTSIPWLLFLFSTQLQQFLFKEGSLLWAIFVFIYVLVLTFSAIIHFREKAWASVHIEIIQDILSKR